MPDDLPEGGDPEVYGIAADVLTAVRRTKALAKLSLRARVRGVIVRDTRERLAKLAFAEADLCEAGNVEKIEPVESDEASIEVELDTDEP
jgi:valyl-tRNA synthetase